MPIDQRTVPERPLPRFVDGVPASHNGNDQRTPAWRHALWSIRSRYGEMSSAGSSSKTSRSGWANSSSIKDLLPPMHVPVESISFPAHHARSSGHQMLGVCRSNVRGLREWRAVCVDRLQGGCCRGSRWRARSRSQPRQRLTHNRLTHVPGQCVVLAETERVDEAEPRFQAI